LAIVAVLAAATFSTWRPLLSDLQEAVASRTAASADEHAGHDHATAGDAHGHDEAAHSDPNHLALSPQAQRNIGLKSGAVTLQPFERVISIPGIVVERPGRTSVAIAAPLTGVVERILAVAGEAVSPGQPLFEVRLTHEEVVQGQSDFLQTVVELEVIGREVARLEEIAAEGAIAGKTFLERKYEQEKRRAALQAHREALILHGLSEEQVDAIARDRKLLAGLTVFAPSGQDGQSSGTEAPVWQVQELNVSPGQHVTAGETLALVTDYRSLFIEGKAFEQDAPEVIRAVEQGWPVAAVIDTAGPEAKQLGKLKISYTSGRVDPDSRAQHFYVALPNRLLRDVTESTGHRFIDWQFKPGQRIDLRVPVEQWTDRIVLPVGAVAREGPESYVFQVNGNSFLRRPVHEEYRDQFSVVIANDGSIFPGDYVALSGARQLQIALKNKSGGAVDPHAGHSH
jgi:multidrug efflux pump subunit AcrA (membrane-fusion protein)